MSLKQIAKQLGISVTTVSRAINGYDDVAAETKEKVLAAAKALGYQPNMMARRLKMGKIDSVGLLLPARSLHENNAILFDIIAEISLHLAKQDIDLLLISDDEDHSSLLRTIQSHRVSALIVAHTMPQDERLKLLQQHDFPFVAMGRSELSKPYAWFDFDNQRGTQIATEYLLAQGHKNIALLYECSPQTYAGQRKHGYEAAFLSAQQPVPVALMCGLRSSRRDGYDAVEKLLAQPQPPTAIVTTSSLLSEGAALALQRRPSTATDVALIGYDGLPEDSFVTQPIDAITQATSQQVGGQIASMMLALLSGQPPEQLQVLWQPQLNLVTSSS